jgi:hypothetical protein
VSFVFFVVITLPLLNGSLSNLAAALRPRQVLCLLLFN